MAANSRPKRSAAVALALLATPILSVLFQRGAFGAADTAATAAALSAYAAGLPAFVLIRVLAPAFFARHDTATPVKIAIGTMAANLGLTLVLMQFLAHVGIALATTIAGWINALTLLLLLPKLGSVVLLVLPVLTACAEATVTPSTSARLASVIRAMVLE